jgi:hypothetical protein
MSMRTLPPTGIGMAIIGVLMAIGGVAAGGAALAGLVIGGIALVGAGAFMVWLGKGWDKPLDDADDLYKYGRPANATVREVEDAGMNGNVRTAKLSLHVTPRNENDYKTTRTVAIPGELPKVGDTVTIKFDPNSRKNFVLLDESYEVKDNITATSEAFFGGLPGAQR